MINPDDIRPQHFECTVFERWYTIEDDESNEHYCRSFIAAAHGFQRLYSEARTCQKAMDDLQELIIINLSWESATADPLAQFCAHILKRLDTLPVTKTGMPQQLIDEFRAVAASAVPRSVADVLWGAGEWAWSNAKYLEGVNFAHPVTHDTFTLIPKPSTETPSGYTWGTPRGRRPAVQARGGPLGAR